MVAKKEGKRGMRSAKIWIATLAAASGLWAGETEHPIDIDDIEWYTPPQFLKNVPEKPPFPYGWNAIDTEWIYMRAIAMVALDYNSFHQDAESLRHVGNLDEYRRWDVRGARAGVMGTLNFSRPVSYLFTGTINTWTKTYDSSKQDAYDILDATVGIPVWGDDNRLRIGKMKEPIAMERLIGLVFEQTMERPMHEDALLRSRNIGIMFEDMLESRRGTWQIGYFNDWLDTSNGFMDNDMVYVGRATWLPVDDLKGSRGLVHLGMGLRYMDVRTGSVRYAVGPEDYFLPKWLDTGEIPASDTLTANLEFTWLKGPFWFASEYTGTKVNSEGRDLWFDGWHASVNWFVTGDERGYDYHKGIVKRILPRKSLLDKGFGALELSARYSTLDLDDGPVHGGKMDVFSAGLIWHPIRETQFHLQWSHAKYTGWDVETRSEWGRSETDILQFRWLLIID